MPLRETRLAGRLAKTPCPSCKFISVALSVTLNWKMVPVDMTFAVATPLLGSTAVIRQHGRTSGDGVGDAPAFDAEVVVPEADGGADGVAPFGADVVVLEEDGGADAPPFDADVGVPEPGDPTVTFNVVGRAELYCRPWGVSPTAVTVRL